MKILLVAFSIIAVLSFIGYFFIFNTKTTAQDTIQLPFPQEIPNQTQYLAFQIFIRSSNSKYIENSFPPMASVDKTTDELIQQIGTVGNANRKLGFIPGPLSFDHTDAEIRDLMRESFKAALQKNIAVGFHIDESMFWGRLSFLNTTENIEWLDWNKTPNTGRRIDWSSTPTKIMPQLCLNSPAVREEVKKRASVIGEEVKQGLEILKKAGKADLFLGLISGWETQIGRDFETGKYLGYCALTNKGFSAEKPPTDIDEARSVIVKEFIDRWTKSLSDSGVPDNKIFSHVASLPKSVYDFMKVKFPQRVPDSYLETTAFASTRLAFGKNHLPGFSTYPSYENLEQILLERSQNGNPPWISSEGTAIDPADAEKGGDGDNMEMYLGNLFNHGAVVVNIFGWGIGSPLNSFRRTAENDEAIQAYRKFLRGEKLNEGIKPPLPTPQFFDKIENFRQKLPRYVRANGPAKVQNQVQNLEKLLKAARYKEAEKVMDEIMKIIEE